MGSDIFHCCYHRSTVRFYRYSSWGGVHRKNYFLYFSGFAGYYSNSQCGERTSSSDVMRDIFIYHDLKFNFKGDLIMKFKWISLALLLSIFAIAGCESNDTEDAMEDMTESAAEMGEEAGDEASDAMSEMSEGA